MQCDPADNRCRLERLAPSCEGAVQNGDETDLNCGGSCPGCADGSACEQSRDCMSQVCEQNTCAVPACGDGVVNTMSEGCDDGGETAYCKVDCTPAVCGDGHINSAAGEECDDSGEGANCDIDCTFVMCGDGVVNNRADELCDEGGQTETCNADCTPAGCDDGIFNPEALEECDDGGESATCDANCTLVECGDGEVNMTAGKQCDDGNQVDTDLASGAFALSIELRQSRWRREEQHVPGSLGQRLHRLNQEKRNLSEQRGLGHLDAHRRSDSIHARQ